MSEERSYRMRLSLSTALSDRARVALRHALSLGDREMRRLEKRASFEADLRPLVEEQKDRLLHNLERVQVSFTPSLVKHAACPRHRRLAEGEICPECERRTCAACRQLSGEGICPGCTARATRKRTFRNVRIVLLLLALFAVALNTWRDRRAITSWKDPVVVALHPVAMDGGEETTSYLESLDAERFQPIAEFLAAEARRHGFERRPLVEIEIAPAPAEPPPLPPSEPSVLDAILFSSSLRWWTWKLEQRLNLPPANIRLYLLFHAPNPGAVLEHSLGLEKGHVGIVHLFASEELEARNQVVIAHELLHTAGATDKYDAGGRPAFPDGYAEPDRSPRHPQERAELMAGGRPLEAGQTTMAQSLDECVIGKKTAAEIGWLSTQ